MPDLTTLRLHSEPYAPTGNMGDGGFSRLLGAPSLESLQLVLREAVQNSCDAAKLGTGPEILVRIRRLSPQEMTAAREILADLPFIESSRLALRAFLDAEMPRVLEICDFGTIGLGGPTRADRMPENTTRTDFIDFLRNVGTQRDTSQGGGTYGFGKASLYTTSQCSTILIDTLTDEAAGSERRFMGCHLGASGSRPEGPGYVRKFTGRHWWGLPSDDGQTNEPVTGEAAKALSRALGLPERTATTTGTSILVLDPDLGDDEACVGSRIVETLLWNFWPRLLDGAAPDKRVTFRVEVDGVVHEMPRPEETPPLNLFAQAFMIARHGLAGAQEITTGRPAKVLGKLAVVRGIKGQRPSFRTENSLLPDTASHIALVRCPADMVISHTVGQPLPDDRVEWAGVFLTDESPEVEGAFARSEPAAHDTWDPSAMPRGAEKTWVTVALRKVKEAARDVAAPGPPPAPSGTEATPLAAVAGRLGAFLEARGHGGPGRRHGSGGSRGGKRRRVSRPEFERLELHQDQATALFSISLSGRGAENLLVLQPALAMDGGSISADRIDGVSSPALVAVEGPAGPLTVRDGYVPVGDLEGTLTVRMTVPEDHAVTLLASLSQEDDA